MKFQYIIFIVLVSIIFISFKNDFLVKTIESQINILLKKSGGEFIWIHDPSAIKKLPNGDYYFLSTASGPEKGIMHRIFHKNNNHFNDIGITQTPDWFEEYIPYNDGAIWAPTLAQDVTIDGKWATFYSAVNSEEAVYEQCGDDDACHEIAGHGIIGLMLADFEDSEYPKWIDIGEPILTNFETSHQGEKAAIDPAVFKDDDGRIYLIWGGGEIYITELNPKTGLLLERPQNKNGYDHRSTKIATTLGSWTEAPYVYKNNGFYYLFVAEGRCCSDVDSTYEIFVGRSENVRGPYLNRKGERMLDGEAEFILGSEGRFIGPGHVGIFDNKETSIFTYHFYDAEDDGLPKLGMTELTWKNGWPVVQHGMEYSLLWDN